MAKVVLLACILPAVAVRKRRRAQDPYSLYDGQHLLSLTSCSIESKTEIAEALPEFHCVSLGYSVGNVSGCGEEMAICSPESAALLTKMFGGQVALLNTDAGGQARATSGNIEPYVSVQDAGVADTFYTNWRGTTDKANRVRNAVASSGGAAKIETIGQSVEGRPIEAVRLTGSGYSSGKTKLVFTFNVHAREWITGMAGVYAVEKMVAKAAADPNWLRDTEIVLVPLANPDGFMYTENSDRYWRKNRRPKPSGWFQCAGVDLNRNFPKDWGGRGSTSRRSCSDVYIGSGALSEPESQALASVFREAPMTVQIDVHSFSQLILGAWSYTSQAHPRKTEVFDLGNQMRAAMRVNGADYNMGDNLLYEASGVVSDYSTQLGALGYTYELRPKSGGMSGFNPSPSLIKPTVEECLEGLYTAVGWAQSKR